MGAGNICGLFGKLELKVYKKLSGMFLINEFNTIKIRRGCGYGRGGVKL